MIANTIKETISNDRFPNQEKIKVNKKKHLTNIYYLPLLNLKLN